MADYLAFTDTDGKQHIWRVPRKPTAQNILHLLGEIPLIYHRALVEGAKNKSEVKQAIAAQLTLPEVESSLKPPGSEN